MSLGIAAIDHVQLTVPKALESECLAFYRTVLGLKEIPKPEELRARGGAWFEVGTQQFHIGVDPEPWPKSKRHVCFLVPDLAKAKASAQARCGRRHRGRRRGRRALALLRPRSCRQSHRNRATVSLIFVHPK